MMEQICDLETVNRKKSQPIIEGVELIIVGRGISKSFFFRRLSVKYIFLAITYFCSPYITEEEMDDSEKLLYLCYLTMLLGEVTIHT